MIPFSILPTSYRKLAISIFRAIISVTRVGYGAVVESISGCHLGIGYFWGFGTVDHCKYKTI